MRHTTSGGLVLLTLLAACSAGQAPGVGDSNSGGSAGASGKGAGATGGASGSSGKAGVGGSSATGSGGSSASGGSSGDAGSSGSSGSAGNDPGVPKINCQPADANAGSPTLRLLTNAEFDRTINAIFPQIAGQWSNTLPANSLSVYGFDNDASSVVGKQLASALLDTALSVATAVTGSNLQNLLPCAAAAKDHACAQTFVEGFGKRLFRRPVAAAESQRYLALFDSGLALSDFPTALKWVTAGMIQSPYAVYRSELGTPSGTTRTLTPYEVATELSYTFKGVPPDDALLAEADAAAGQPIADPVGKATAMLKTPEGQTLVQQFFSAYLGTTGVTTKVKANLTSGDANFGTASADMIKETTTFIKNVVLENPGTLRDFLTSPTTYPTQALARFYGSEATNTAKFPLPASDGAATARPAGQGIGILAQGSFLAAHANTDASSPTQRGLFVYSRLLCRPKITPPNVVPPLATSVTAKTTRQRYEEAHTANATCKGCHVNFDPIGFGFEAFDEGGRFRTEQNGVTIDAAAAIPTDTGDAGQAFGNQEELAQALADLPEAGECFAAYLATFAYGSAEACTGTTNAGSIFDGSVGLLEAYAKLAAEKHFTERNPQ